MITTKKERSARQEPGSSGQTVVIAGVLMAVVALLCSITMGHPHAQRPPATLSAAPNGGPQAASDAGRLRTPPEPDARLAEVVPRSPAGSPDPPPPVRRHNAFAASGFLVPSIPHPLEPQPLVTPTRTMGQDSPVPRVPDSVTAAEAAHAAADARATQAPEGASGGAARGLGANATE